MVELFQAAAEAVGSVIKRFYSMEEAVGYLVLLADGGTVVRSALPAKVEQAVEKLASGADAPADATLCISVAQAAIAATGSLLIDLQEPEDRAATALVPVHAVFLDPSTIVPTLYDLGDRLNQLLTAGDQAYFSLTTGPSRTADIERVLTIGVHGPKELHILIVEGCCHG